MAVTPKQIIEGTSLTAAIATYYTAPVNTTTIIRRASFTNYSGEAQSINVWLVPNGGTATNNNIVLQDQALAIGQTLSASDIEGQILEPGDSLQAQAGITASVNIMASGTEIV
jgi:hypothetical protein